MDVRVETWESAEAELMCGTVLQIIHLNIFIAIEIFNHHIIDIEAPNFCSPTWR